MFMHKYVLFMPYLFESDSPGMPASALPAPTPAIPPTAVSLVGPRAHHLHACEGSPGLTWDTCVEASSVPPPAVL